MDILDVEYFRASRHYSKSKLDFSCIASDKELFGLCVGTENLLDLGGVYWGSVRDLTSPVHNTCGCKSVYSITLRYSRRAVFHKVKRRCYFRNVATAIPAAM